MVMCLNASEERQIEDKGAEKKGEREKKKEEPRGQQRQDGCKSSRVCASQHPIRGVLMDKYSMV